jgi:hypothetical protein
VQIPEYGYNHFTLNGRNTFDALDDKGQWPSQRNYTYSRNTSTSVLRLHLNCFHIEEYAKIAEERDWVVQLPSLKGKATEGTMVTSKPKVSFTPDMVTNHLIRFIVANDQVSSIVLYCTPKFMDFIVVH